MLVSRRRSGIGRTGAFLLIYTGMQEILHGSGMIDIRALAKRMLQKRKNIIHKKEQLKFCYDALLCFAEDFLKKRESGLGISLSSLPPSLFFQTHTKMLRARMNASSNILKLTAGEVK